MTPKLKLISELAVQTAHKVTNSSREWTSFLTTAARLYKYPFNDQLLIFAQRPDATACARMEQWNSSMHRWVKSGSKGIALIKMGQETPGLEYVFDVADTYPVQGGRAPKLWQMQEEHYASVQEYLIKTNSLSNKTNGILEIMTESAALSVEQNYDDYFEDLMSAKGGSFLEELDEQNTGVLFRDLLTASVEYILLSRCGINVDQRFMESDFQSITNFNTLATLSHLGNAASRISKPILMGIERAVKEVDRNKVLQPLAKLDHEDYTNNIKFSALKRERSIRNDGINLHEERGLFNSRPDDGQSGVGGQKNFGQIRNASGNLPTGAPERDVYNTSVVRGTTEALAGDRSDSTGANRPDNTRTTESGSGTEQRNQSDGLGTAHERSEGISGGNRAERTDLQLNTEEKAADDESVAFSSMDNNPTEYLQRSLFPTVEEQVDTIAQAKAEAHAPTFFFSRVTDEVIDRILTSGGNERTSALRIFAQYEEGRSADEIAQFLSKEYGKGGKGFTINGAAYSLWFDQNGLAVGSGKTARFNSDSVRLTWAESEVRIRALIRKGNFISADSMSISRDNEIRELSQQLWYLRQDFSEDANQSGYLPRINQIYSSHGGFPKNTAQIYALLKTRYGIGEITNEIKQFCGAYKENHDLLRFQHQPSNLMNKLELLQRPAQNYPSTPGFRSERPTFITGDEIDDFLSGGSNISDSKISVYIFFKNHPGHKERQDFLKKHYGDGGSGTLTRNTWHDSKGLKISRSDGLEYDSVSLKWPQAEKRISELFIINRYMTSADMARIPEYELEHLSMDVNYFFSHANDQRPYTVADSSDGWENVRNMLNEPAQVETLLIAMKDTMKSFTPDMRGYKSCIQALNDLTAYHAGTYTLLKSPKTVSGISESKLHPLENSEATISNVLETDEGQLTFGFPDDKEMDLRNNPREQIPEKHVTENSPEDMTDFEFPLTPNVPEYLNLKIDHPEHLIGVKVGDLFLFYGKDAEPAAAALESNIIKREIPGLGFTSVTGYSGWADAGERLRQHGHSVTFAQPEGDGYEIIKSLSGEDYIPIGVRFDIDNRLFEVESVDFDRDKVSLKDITFQGSTGFPISRIESIAYAHSCWDEQQDSDYNSKLLFNAAVQDCMEEHKDEIKKHTDSSPVLKTNFRILEVEPEAGGQKSKYQSNAVAIRTLKQIEAEDRLATPEEQKVLSRYVGWGGLPQAFDSDNAKWTKEYTELKELLTDEEYILARGSVLNAHYTSPVVIKAMYDTLTRMGFRTGNALEPGCGIGNFFGLIPESMAKSKFYGVELDSITGRITQQLYQKINITIDGFERTVFPDDFFDLSLGNVPFGDYQIADRKYDKYHFAIHDYFFAKSIDQVRPGGLIAFITSKGTMDKANPEVRKYIARRTDLLGAVRLPNNAFFANAGTEVTSDILFLQKRSQITNEEPEWVSLGKTPDGIPVNHYFVEHPEMILGTMAYSARMYGNEKETACLPIKGAGLAQQLQTAMQEIALPDPKTLDMSGLLNEKSAYETIPADPDVRNFSYALINDKLYFRENSLMKPVEVSQTAAERIRGMMEIRDCTRQLIDTQLKGSGDEPIHLEQNHLNLLYDRFTKEYGLINSVSNKRAFEQDSSYCLLCSLELLDEDGKLKCKADMFTKRTINQQKVITSVDTPSEALAVSIGERGYVDIGYMASLLGGSDKDETVIHDLQGIIFKNPKSGNDLYTGWEPADEYLSGNVREKLSIARAAVETDPAFAINVTSLEKVQPKELGAAEIEAHLGVTWIDQDYYSQFVHELLQTPQNLYDKISVRYASVTGVWNISGKSADSVDNALVYVTYGTKRINAYSILEDSLNLRDSRVYDCKIDAEGKEHRELNGKETAIAQQRQESIAQAFRNWVWKAPERRDALCKQYNKIFNSTRPREYDGQHIRFVGMNPEIALRTHQLNAVAHILYGKNTLLAHCVGAGKTFEMIAAGMESKRLGLAQKSLYVVPNHLTEQWGGDFLRLYPGAKILVATKKDFEPQNRKKFCARIATGDYDAVIIGHSQFEKIPVSQERQAQTIHGQIFEITLEIKQAKDKNGEKYTIKQMEKTKKSLQARLEKLNDSTRKDDVVTFEQLGVDRLFVDEADSFKNLFLYTKMRNVAGIGQTEAQKSSDMFTKCRYMDELTDGRGVTFATGTPVSNSMTELYTMMRYLQYSTLQELGLEHFDSWAAEFGEKVTAIELAPEGTGFRAKTRFARFFNLPELMSIWKEAADIQTADMLHLPTPTPEYITIVIKPSEFQKEGVQSFADRADKVRRSLVEPYEDNMLKITNDGRNLALDQRLYNELLPDDPNSKLNACITNILNVWKNTAEEHGTQLVFCDQSTPKGVVKMEMVDGVATMSGTLMEVKFNVYYDIRRKLLNLGVPAEQIAFIHEAKTEIHKSQLFAKVRNGQVRILLGSTSKMGAGTNVQDYVTALHHLSVPWKPRDIEQREGRAIRQGNRNKTVKIFRYVTEGTFDAYSWALIENKQKFIGQVVTGKSPARSCEDVDATALSYAEVKALATGDPRIKEKMDLDIQVAKLKMLKADYTNQHYQLEDNLLKHFPNQIQSTQEQISALEADLKHLTENTPNVSDSFSMVVMGKTYAEKKDAGAALIEACKQMTNPGEILDVGEYRGFPMQLSIDSFNRKFTVIMKYQMSHTTELWNDPLGNVTRINNTLDSIPTRLAKERDHLETIHQQVQTSEKEVNRPFPQDTVLNSKMERLNQLNVEMSADTASNIQPVQEESDEVTIDLNEKLLTIGNKISHAKVIAKDLNNLKGKRMSSLDFRGKQNQI